MHTVRAIVSALGDLASGRSAAGGRARRGGGPVAGRASPVGRMRPPGATPPAVPEPVVEGDYVRAGTEPPLAEVLREPIVQQIMRADRLEPAEVGRALAAGVPNAGRRPRRRP